MFPQWMSYCESSIRFLPRSWPWLRTLVKPIIIFTIFWANFTLYFFLAKCGEEHKWRDLDCETGNGANYCGRQNVTRSGIACQKWSSQKPHRHGFDTLGDHNYCRNPDGEPHAWCYTVESKRWEFCGIRTCNQCDKK